MDRFENDILRLLVNAGWSETYRFGISPYLEWYRLFGCDPSEEVSDFLTHFGGLYIGTSAEHAPRSSLPFNLDPYPMLYRTKPCIDYVLLAEVIEISPCSIFHLGRACNDNMDILMASDGRVFLALDELILYVAKNGTDAIETLCHDRELTIINSPTE